MAAHRYWRLRSTSATGSGFYGLHAFSLYETGGLDVVTAAMLSASTEYSGTYVAGNAHDGLPGTFYSSTNGTSGNGDWIKCDLGLGNAKDITKVVIASDNGGRLPGTYDFEYSDDNSTWTSAFSGTMPTTLSNTPYTITSSGAVEGVGYKVRIRITATPTGTYASFAEVEFLGVQGFATAASSEFGGWPATNAFDGNNATRWITGGDGNGQTIELTTASSSYSAMVANFTGVRVVGSDVSGEWSRVPQHFVIEGWDGASWNLLQTIDALPFTYVNEERTFPVDGYSYWRVLFDTSPTPNYYVNVGEVYFWDASFNDLCIGGASMGSANFSGSTYNAAKAFDRDAGTTWSGDRDTSYATGDGSFYLGYHFAAPVNPYVARVKPFDGSGNAPYKIQHSIDGTTWVDAGFTGGSNSLVFLRDIPEAEIGPKEYWRVFILECNGTEQPSCSKITMRENGNQGDLCTGGTSISSGELSGSYLDDYAFTTNDSQFWVCLVGGNLPQYIGYQFASPVDIKEVCFRNRSGYGVEAMKTALIQGSDDGVTWQTSFSVTGQTGWRSSGELRRFRKSSFELPDDVDGHRYWRLLNYQKRQRGDYCGISNLELRQTASGPNIAVSGNGGVATADATQDAAFLDAQCAFDLFTDTLWQKNGSNADAGSWLEYDFGDGAAPNITEIRIQPDKDLFSRTFGTFAVQYSDNGSSWHDSWYCNYDWDFGTSGGPITFTKPDDGDDQPWWGIFILDNMNHGAVTLSELMLIDDTTTNVSSLVDAYVGNPIYDGGTPYSAAFDANTATIYGTSSAVPVFFGFHLTSDKAIRHMDIQARNDATYYVQTPTDGFVLAGPDGKCFMRRSDFSGLVYSGALDTEGFDVDEGGVDPPDPDPTGRRRYTFSP